jgi:hypothetical protein
MYHRSSLKKVSLIAIGHEEDATRRACAEQRSTARTRDSETAQNMLSIVVADLSFTLPRSVARAPQRAAVKMVAVSSGR